MSFGVYKPKADCKRAFAPTIDSQTPAIDNGPMSSDEKLDEILRRIGLLETGVQNLGTRLEAVEGKVALLKETGAALTVKAEALDAKVETRLQDTRPLWQGVQAQIKELHTDMQAGFRKLEHKIELHARN